MGSSYLSPNHFVASSSFMLSSLYLLLLPLLESRERDSLGGGGWVVTDKKKKKTPPSNTLSFSLLSLPHSYLSLTASCPPYLFSHHPWRRNPSPHQIHHHPRRRSPEDVTGKLLHLSIISFLGLEDCNLPKVFSLHLQVFLKGQVKNRGRSTPRTISIELWHFIGVLLITDELLHLSNRPLPLKVLDQV